MKKLSYIIVLFLSLLITYSGAGVAIVHYCCSHCEVVEDSCCVAGCSQCEELHCCESHENLDRTLSGETNSGRPDIHVNTDEKVCTATIYKLDLIKQATGLSFLVPVQTLFHNQPCYLSTCYVTDQSVVYSDFSSPPLLCSRQMLALHSVFLI